MPIDLKAQVLKAFQTTGRVVSGVVLSATYEALSFEPDATTGGQGETVEETLSISVIRTDKTQKVVELLGVVGGQLEPSDEIYLAPGAELTRTPAAHDRLTVGGVSYAVLGHSTDPAGASVTLAVRRRP